MTFFPAIGDKEINAQKLSHSSWNIFLFVFMLFPVDENKADTLHIAQIDDRKSKKVYQTSNTALSEQSGEFERN